MATIRQKNSFKKVLNGSTISKAMVLSGYSKKTATSTGKLTNTKGWKELLELHLSDKELALKHKELLNKREIVRINGEELNQPETQAVSRALDMAYKLKGKYPTEGEGNKTLVVVISGETAERFKQRQGFI